MQSFQTILPTLVVLTACSSNVDARDHGCPQLIRNANQIMTRYDTNHDGRIDSEEWKPIALGLSEMARQTNERYNSKGGENTDQYFEDGDLNRDGYIEVWEIARYPTNDVLVLRSCLRHGEFRNDR